MSQPTELEGLVRLLIVVSEHYRETVGSQVADGCVEAARILQALKEPSEGMVAAARMTMMATRGEPKDVISSAVFTAMIQSILEEASE